MHKIFVPLYRFFEQHKLLMFVLLALTSFLFVWFGAKARFEEDITKLIPSTGSSEKGLAFGSLRVKDKIFIQIAAREGHAEAVDIDLLTEEADAFADALLERDSTTCYIDDILYTVSVLDLLGNVEDTLKYHLPSFIPTDVYGRMEELLTPEAARERMEWNLEHADETTLMLIDADPLGLFRSFSDEAEGMNLGVGAFTLMNDHLVSRDTTVAYLFLSPSFVSTDTGAGTDLVTMIREEAEAFNATHEDVEVLFHGAPVRSVNNSRRIKMDLLITIGLSLLVILGLIVLCFKDWKVIPFQLLPVIYGTFFALSCVYWIKGGMSLLAMGIGAIVLGVALSYCLHIITHFKYTGDPEKVLREEATPVTLGAITTIGAFSGLLFTQSELLRDFGMFASLGLFGSTLFALIFLPHFFRKGDINRNWKAFHVIDRINAVQFHRRKGLMAVIFVVTALCIAFSPKIGFDKDLRNLSYFEEETLRSEKLFSVMNYNRDSINAYYAAADADLDAALIYNARVMEQLDSLQKAGIVHGYSDVVSKIFIPKQEQIRRTEAWNAFWTPERQKQALTLARNAAREVGYYGDFYTFEDEILGMDRDPQQTLDIYASELFPEPVVSNFIEKCGDRFLVFTPVRMSTVAEKDATSDALTEKGMSDHIIAVDPMYYIRDMVEIVHRDFDIAVLISSLFVLLVLLVSFKSIWSAILSFIPMALSWYVVQGAMVLLGLQFNLINIVISTFIFGIGVDYSIFVMEGLLSVARTGSDRLLIWHKSAIFFSALVLLVVMCSLLFAVHPSIGTIGLSALIGMATTILFSYTIQPFLFHLMMRFPYFQRSFQKE